MIKKWDGKYYLGLDIGTDSVGYAVTDEQYNLLRFHGEDAWGSAIFDAAKLKADRRAHRSDRRRLDRRKQRVKLLQEIFAKEIAKVDERFFVRLDGSYLWREDTTDRYTVFEDENYTDKEYHREFQTIHHLICELMENKDSHDIRHVYLACAWLVAHRGHFLANIDVKNLSEVKNIDKVYEDFRGYFSDNEFVLPWKETDIEMFGEILKEKVGVTLKKKKLSELLLGSRKPNKEVTEEFPFSEDAILKLLAGGCCKPKELFGKEEYADLDNVTLSMDDDKLAELAVNIGEDYALIEVLRKLADWAVLADVMDNAETISQAKVEIYEQHKADLKQLKRLIRKYQNDKYDEVFRSDKPGNYVRYSYHTKELEADQAANIKKKADTEEFSKYILKILNEITPAEEDRQAYEDMRNRLELRQFLPKQKNADNRIIPCQLYLYELNKILDNASLYLSFLNEEDETGISNKQKIIDIFQFKLPYFVGPLNERSAFSWLKRTNEKIKPWNYEQVIDLEVSEENFIKRMTNQCTYLPGNAVLPKDSLCYQKFCVLNEINNLKINGIKIPVEAKQGIYHEVFEKKKKVRKKDIVAYLISNNYLKKNEEDSLSGIDNEVQSTLSTHIAFRRILEKELLSTQEVEDIVERSTYAEDKVRVAKYIEKKYPQLSKEDIKYITGIKIKDFGRLSREFLTDLEGKGISSDTEERFSILRALWETNDNLMELLSDRYTFMENIRNYSEDYYAVKKKSLEDKLDDMYLSNAVKRPIYRTLDIVNDLYKAFGTPKKIFIEMTRGTDSSQKGKRTTPRKRQILDLYSKCREEEVRELKQQLEAMGEWADSKLQGDKLFLYFMQFGVSAYSGKPIVLEKLLAGSKDYDIDHIYPQAYVKDDSILNNKALVYSQENGTVKKDKYPIPEEIRSKMYGVWTHWKKIGAISEEKYKRFIRSSGFTDDEKRKFINRQLTETSQSTKAVAELLKSKYPTCEIVYTKAGLTTDFRQEYDVYKVRSYNDQHHAVDAYLNIVTGNVYHMRFSRRWFSLESDYNVQMKKILKHRLVCGEELVWDGDGMLKKVIRTARKNTPHCTKYSFFRMGELFDQQPVKKREGLVPLKKGLDTQKYGGYNKPAVMFFIPIKYTVRRKTEICIMPVELMYGKKFLEDEEFARQYSKDRLKRIINKEVDSLDFPMGVRPLKINTLLSLDGFKVCITGSAGLGKQLVVQSLIQFASDDFWKAYIKKLERFTEKTERNPNYLYDEEYDKVNCAKNLELYDIYIDKLENSIYQKRANSPKDKLVIGRDKFITLDIKEQSKVLLKIHQVFGRNTQGIDLSLIGADKASGAPKISAFVSNWTKNYKEVRVIDESVTGLWRKQSENLLELL